MPRRVLFSTTNTGGVEQPGGALDATGGRPVIFDEVALDSEGFFPDASISGKTEEEKHRETLRLDTLLRQQALHTGTVTLEHLSATGYIPAARTAELHQSYENYIADLPSNSPLLDMIAFLVWIKLEKRDEEGMKEISRITDILRDSFSPRIPRGGFTQALKAPADFYANFPEVKAIARTLMTPIVQSHEGDFISTASINPLSSAASANLIATWFEKQNDGRKPFAFLLSLAPDIWTDMCTAHFS